MTTDNVCFYLQNRLIQTSQTGGQWYSDTSPFSIPWFNIEKIAHGCPRILAEKRYVNLPSPFEWDHENKASIVTKFAMGPSWRGSKTTRFLGGSPLGPWPSFSAKASAAWRFDILIQSNNRRASLSIKTNAFSPKAELKPSWPYSVVEGS